jgi:hypothetical protein
LLMTADRTPKPFVQALAGSCSIYSSSSKGEKDFSRNFLLTDND